MKREVHATSISTGKEYPLQGKELYNHAVNRLLQVNHAYVRPPWIREGPLWRVNENGIMAPDPNRYDPGFPWIPKGEVYITAANPEMLLENPFDLNNLRIIEQKRVVMLLNDLETLVADPESENKAIVAMINSGGTIMMKPNAKGKLDIGLSSEELMNNLGREINNQFAAAKMDLPEPIDSSQMEIDYGADLVICMSYIWNNASPSLQKRLNGFVIAHGTDTMAGSASNIAMMLGPDLPFPVGFSGAQKTQKDAPTDAQANIVTALHSVRKLHNEGINTVFLAMNGTSGGAYLAVGADKISDQSVRAFHTPAHPMILNAENFFEYGARLDFAGDYIGVQPSRRTATAIATGTEWFPILFRGYSPVQFITPKMGEDPKEVYESIARSDKKYVAVTTFGSFTMNIKLLNAILELPEIKNGSKMLVAGNPFATGHLDHAYALALGDKSPLIIPTAVLPLALLGKLMVADRLIPQDKSSFISFLAGTNYVGEQPEIYWKTFSKEHEAHIGLPHGFPQVLCSGIINMEAN